MKSKIKKILENPIFGRPISKIFWMMHKVACELNRYAMKGLQKHPYVQKLNRNGRPTEGKESGLIRYYEALQGTMNNAPYRPVISIIIPVYKVKAEYLIECLQSLAAQTYSQWEACIVDDCSQDLTIDAVINAFSERHGIKVKYLKNEKNSHISISSNNALKMATGEYVAFLDHDDRLLPNALGEVVRFLNLHNKPDIIYSDESIINEKGEILGHYHKPDWSPFMHLSVNYTTHFSVYRRTLVEEIGGCRAGFEGAQDHDMMMRAVEKTTKNVVHIPILLYQWRSHELSTAGHTDAKPYAGLAGVKAIEEACVRRGRPAKVIFEPKIHHYKVFFDLPVSKPLVSILILTRDGFDLIQPCLDTIFTKSTYLNFEIILIDHETKDERCLKLFEHYKSRYADQFNVIQYSGPFNFGRKNNIAAEAARGKFLILLNNDVEVISENWIEELLAVAQFEEVGAVGGKLLYPNGKIQHAGVVGLGSAIAGHNAIGEDANTMGYSVYHQTTHEVMGVTGACLMISKEKFMRVGGLEDFYVANGFGDVDLCLKLRQIGLSNIYVPYAVLTHKESYTRKETFELFEKYYMLEKWSKELLRDPYRHIAFEMNSHFTIEVGYRVQEPSHELFTKLLNNPEPS